MNFFDHLKDLTSSKTDLNFSDPEIEKSYDKFMINRYISMNTSNLDIVIPMNMLAEFISKELQSLYYRNALPKNKTFFKYITKTKTLYSKDQVNVIMEHFECGNNDIEMILNIMTDKEIEAIIKSYTNEKSKK